MTITSIRPMRGELPPGTVDGYCTICAGDTIVSAPDYACPACGNPVHPDSLPRDARLAMMRGQTGAQAAESDDEPTPAPVEPIRAIAARTEPPAVKTVTLPATKETMAWDRATDAMVAAADAAEARTLAAYETAKAEYKAARDYAARVRQMRQLVQVAPVDSVTAAPEPSTNGKRWARNYDACVNCGTTRIKHGSKGRCGTCATHLNRHGVERPTTTEAQTHGN